MGPGDDIMTDAYETVRKFIQDHAPDAETCEALLAAFDEAREDRYGEGYDDGYTDGCGW